MRSSPSRDEHARKMMSRACGWGNREPLRGRSRPGVEWLEGRELLSLGVLPDYRITQDWGSGFQAEMSLANQDPQRIANWTLAFDFSGQITSIWDARVV